MTAPVVRQRDTAGWFGHPRGLSTLFFTEMWERFSFYGLKALLILFMTAAVTQGGLGFSSERAGGILGWYGFGVYASAILGGVLADRVFGQYRSVLLGGIIIAAGHFSMAFPTLATFYLGLCLIVVGTGLLKPNASTMVGALYDADDARRDAGFSIFYGRRGDGDRIDPVRRREVTTHTGVGTVGANRPACRSLQRPLVALHARRMGTRRRHCRAVRVLLDLLGRL